MRCLRRQQSTSPRAVQKDNQVVLVLRRSNVKDVVFAKMDCVVGVTAQLDSPLRVLVCGPSPNPHVTARIEYCRLHSTNSNTTCQSYRLLFGVFACLLAHGFW